MERGCACVFIKVPPWEYSHNSIRKIQKSPGAQWIKGGKGQRSGGINSSQARGNVFLLLCEQRNGNKRECKCLLLRGAGALVLGL